MTAPCRTTEMASIPMDGLQRVTVVHESRKDGMVVPPPILLHYSSIWSHRQLLSRLRRLPYLPENPPTPHSGLPIMMHFDCPFAQIPLLLNNTPTLRFPMAHAKHQDTYPRPPSHRSILFLSRLTGAQRTTARIITLI